MNHKELQRAISDRLEQVESHHRAITNLVREYRNSLDKLSGTHLIYYFLQESSGEPILLFEIPLEDKMRFFASPKGVELSTKETFDVLHPDTHRAISNYIPPTQKVLVDEVDANGNVLNTFNYIN
jgi:hypothetical protein